jgi:D-aspartate ligase
LAKVYICQSWEELLESLDHVYAAGYQDHMVLQEFIPGDDSYMRVLTNYSDRNGKVTMMCLGHVLLEEHSPHGIGNHAVILTEYDEGLEQKIKTLLEALHFTGFSNFDIKYDSRDGKYKAFEINCRQGRSNYYVTGAGHNIAKLVVEDRVEGKDKELEITKNRSLWRMVPKQVAFKFTPKKYHAEMRALIKAGNDSHSLVYQKDTSLKRRLRVWKNHIGNMKRFDQYNKIPE